MSIKSKGSVLVIITILALLLSSCATVREELTLKPDEEWNVRMSMLIPASTVSLIGADQITSQQSEWEKQAKEWEVKGVTASLETKTEKNGDVTYSVVMSGKGLALLSETAFSGESILTPADKGRYNFHADAGDLSSLTQAGGSFTFVLKAGSIRSSNATTVKGNTATWENPTAPMEAEVTLSGSSSGLLIGLIVVVVLAVIVAALVLLYRRGRKLQSTPPAQPLPPEPEPPAQPPAPGA